MPISSPEESSPQTKTPTVLARLSGAASSVTAHVLWVTDWIGTQFHVSSKWASRFGFIVLWGAGMTFIQVDEYAAALILWTLSSIVLLAKAIHWQGIKGKPRLTRVLRVIYLFLALGFIPISVTWTQAKKGDKSWTAMHGPHGIMSRGNRRDSSSTNTTKTIGPEPLTTVPRVQVPQRLPFTPHKHQLLKPTQPPSDIRPYDLNGTRQERFLTFL